MSFNYNFTGSTTTINPVSIASGTAIGSQIPVTPTAPSSSYTFLGWNTQANGLGSNLNANTVISDNVTYYAIWSRLYTVTFNESTGSFEDTTLPTACSIKVPENAALGDTPVITNLGSYFIDWSISATAGAGTVYRASSIINSDVNLYPTWSVSPCTITFDRNNAPSTVVMPASITIAQGSQIGQLPIPDIWDGHVFKGWYTATTGGTQITDTTTFSSNTTVYAQWETLHTVTFNVAGGTPSISPASVIHGSTLGTLPTNPTKTDYLFAGWKDASNNWFNQTTVVNADLTLTAQWVPTSTLTYTVRFYRNDGSSPQTLITTKTAFQNGCLLEFPIDPIKSHSTFIEWNTNPEGGASTRFTSNTQITSDLDVYAIWQTEKQTISYLGNGNTAGSVPANATPDYGSTYSVAGAGSLAKTGYTFAGWLSSADNLVYDPAGARTSFQVGSDVALTAQWTPASQTISYHENYGTGTTASTIGNTGTSVTLASNNFTRTGYTFSDWNTAANGTGTSLAAGSTYTMPAESITLYAQWTANSYTVTYAAEDKTSGTVPSSVSSYYDDLFTVADQGTLVKAGYTFAGWKNSINNQTYVNGTSNSAFFVTGDTILTAQWTANTQTITYSAADKTSGTVPSSESTQYDATFTVTGPGNLSKTGYTFAGWKSSIDDQIYALDSAHPSFTVTGDTILTAQWTINNYTITFDRNDGTNEADPATRTANYNNSVATLPTAPTRTGYDFMGWFTGDGSNGQWGSQFTTSTIVTASIPVYAKWQKINYTITFNENYGVNNTSTKSADYQTNLTGNMPSDPSRTGYNFLGWYTQDGGLNDDTWGTAFDASTSIESSLTVYARWTLNSNSVTFNSNQATGGSVPSILNSQDYGSTVHVPGNTGSLARTGYTFAGWNTQADGQGTDYPLNGSSNSFTMPDSNVILYARWTINQFSLTYNGNDSTGGSVPADQTLHDYNSTVTTALNTGNLTKTGFYFAGWNTAADGSGTNYSAGANLTMPAGDLTLYAMWRSPRYPDSDNNNNGLMETSTDFAQETKLVIEEVQKTEDNVIAFKQMFAAVTKDGTARKAFDLRLFERSTVNTNWSELPTNQVQGFAATIYLNVQDLIDQGYAQSALNLYYYDSADEPKTPMDILRFETIDGDLHLVFETDHFSYYVIVADDPATPEDETVLAPGKVELETLLKDPDTGTLTTDMKSYLSIPEQWMPTTQRIETWLDVHPVENHVAPAIKAPDSIIRTYDIKLMKRVTNTDGSSTESGVDPAQIIHNIAVRLSLDATLQNAKNLRVAVLMPDGQLAFLTSEILTIDGQSYLAFENNVLSKILIVASGTMDARTSDQSDFEQANGIPKTGESDTRLAGVLILFLALASLLVFKRRKDRVN